MSASIDLPFHRAYTAKEMKRIAAGYIPTMSPGDPWFMYYEHGILRIYRVSSGVLTFEMHFEHDPMSGLARTTLVRGNRDPKHQMRATPRAEARFLEFVLGMHFGLEHRDLPFPKAPEDALREWNKIEPPGLFCGSVDLRAIRDAADPIVRAFGQNEGVLSCAQTAQLALVLGDLNRIAYCRDSEDSSFAKEMDVSIRAVLSHLARLGTIGRIDWVVAEAAPRNFTYWVRPGILMAGRHPRRTGYPTMVSSLVESNGVRSFIDLSGRTGQYDYAAELNDLSKKNQQVVDYFRLPIREGSVTDTDLQMIAILDTLDECVEQAQRDGRTVYVHCSSGAGRTGLVIGCYLVRHGMQAHQALKHLKHLFQPLPGSAKRRIPENDKQEDYILTWAERDRPPLSAHL